MARRTMMLALLVLSPWLLTAPAQAQPSWASDKGETASEQQRLQLGEDVVITVGVPEGSPVSGDLLAARTESLASEIRCPVCQGQSVQASTAEAARNMKDQMRAMVAAGYSDDQVLRYFEASYGEFIRMMPRAEGFNLLVWIIPALALLLGALFTWRVIVKLGARPRQAAPGKAETKPEQPAPTEEAPAAAAQLEPWLQKVRDELEASDG